MVMPNSCFKVHSAAWVICSDYYSQ